MQNKDDLSIEDGEEYDNQNDIQPLESIYDEKLDKENNNDNPKEPQNISKNRHFLILIILNFLTRITKITFYYLETKPSDREEEEEEIPDDPIKAIYDNDIQVEYSERQSLSFAVDDNGEGITSMKDTELLNKKDQLQSD